MTENATYRELRRSRSDRMIAGVCGGLGRYFNVNPVFYRVGFVVLTLLGGAGILIYGAALLVIPNEGEHESIASDILRNHRQRPFALAGLGLVALAGIALLSHVSFRIHSDTFWALVLAGGAFILWQNRREGQTTPPGDPVATVDTPEPRRRSKLRIALLGIGVLLVAAVVTIAAFVGSYLHLGDGVGDRNYAPASATRLHDYKLGVGDMSVDLGNLELPAGTTRVKAHLGIGHLQVIVPAGATVRVLGHVTWGDLDALGHHESGHDVSSDVGTDPAQLVLDARVDVGQIEVTRAVR